MKNLMKILLCGYVMWYGNDSSVYVHAANGGFDTKAECQEEANEMRAVHNKRINDLNFYICLQAGVRP